MSNSIFILGKINKKLILPLIQIILHIFIHFYWGNFGYYGFNLARFYLEVFGYSIGEITTFFIRAFLFRNNSKNIKKNTKNDNNSNYFKDYMIMFILEAFYELSHLLSVSLEYETKNEDEGTSLNLYTNNSIEIILLSLITYYVLKYKYYIHHIISIVLIVICGFIIDIILGNFQHTDAILLANSMFYILINI